MFDGRQARRAGGVTLFVMPAALAFAVVMAIAVANLTSAGSAPSTARADTLSPYQTETTTTTPTPVETATEPSPTETRTETPLPATATPTATPGLVSACRFQVLNGSACINTSGCVEYSIPVRNRGDDPVVVSGTVVLEARGNEIIGETAIPLVTLDPGTITYISTTVCPTIAAPGPYHLEVTLQSTNPECRERNRQETVRDVCAPTGELAAFDQ